CAFGGQHRNFAERIFLHSRLLREDTDQVLAARISKRELSHSAMRPSTQEARDARFRLVADEYRNETAVALFIVKIIVEEAAFPMNAFALFGRHFAFDAPPIFRRADADHEVRMLAAGLLVAPARPVHNFLVVE